MNLAQTIRRGWCAGRSRSKSDESDQHLGHAAGGRVAATSASSSSVPLCQGPAVRHRMVLRGSRTLMHKDIHALAIHALAPDDYDARFRAVLLQHGH